MISNYTPQQGTLYNHCLTFYVKYSVLSSSVKVLLTCLPLFRFLDELYHINMRPSFLQLWKDNTA